MKIVTDFVERIVKDYGYRPLPKDKSQLARDWYRKHLPQLCANMPLYTLKAEPLTSGFHRIVIGDYGAFVEFFPEQVVAQLETAPGQEFRLSPNFGGKYIWLTTKSKCCKIYHQIGYVRYADYKPGRMYISPYEVYQLTDVDGK